MQSVEHDNFFGKSSFEHQKPLEQRHKRKVHHYAGEDDSEGDDFMNDKRPAEVRPRPIVNEHRSSSFASQRPMQNPRVVRMVKKPQYGYNNGRAAQIQKDLAASYEDQMEQEGDLLNMPEDEEIPDEFYL